VVCFKYHLLLLILRFVVLSFMFISNTPEKKTRWQHRPINTTALQQLPTPAIMLLLVSLLFLLTVESGLPDVTPQTLHSLLRPLSPQGAALTLLALDSQACVPKQEERKGEYSPSKRSAEAVAKGVTRLVYHVSVAGHGTEYANGYNKNMGGFYGKRSADALAGAHDTAVEMGAGK
jgi:hypothetical protein